MKSTGEAVQEDPFIDDIYEAAMIPEKWQAILDRLAVNGRCRRHVAFRRMPGNAPMAVIRVRSSKSSEEWIGSKWYLDNPRGQRLVPIEEPRFLTDLDAMTIEEIEASDFYTELLRPRGLGWCVGTSIRSPAGDTLVFSIEKAHAKGPVPRAVAEKLDTLAAASCAGIDAFGTPRAGSREIDGRDAGSDRLAGCGAGTERPRGFGECGISRQRTPHPDRRWQS